MSNVIFPNLAKILGVYFHQDWTEEFRTEQAAVDGILKNEERERLRLACAEIDQLLKLEMDEDRLRTYTMTKLHFYLDASHLGLTEADWLASLKMRLENHVKASR